MKTLFYDCEEKPKQENSKNYDERHKRILLKILTIK